MVITSTENEERGMLEAAVNHWVKYLERDLENPPQQIAVFKTILMGRLQAQMKYGLEIVSMQTDNNGPLGILAEAVSEANLSAKNFPTNCEVSLCVRARRAIFYRRIDSENKERILYENGKSVLPVGLEAIIEKAQDSQVQQQKASQNRT